MTVSNTSHKGVCLPAAWVYIDVMWVGFPISDTWAPGCHNQ
jgi:hypothetical protein